MELAHGEQQAQAAATPPAATTEQELTETPIGSFAVKMAARFCFTSLDGPELINRLNLVLIDLEQKNFSMEEQKEFVEKMAVILARDWSHAEKVRYYAMLAEKTEKVTNFSINLFTQTALMNQIHKKVSRKL